MTKNIILKQITFKTKPFKNLVILLEESQNIKKEKNGSQSHKNIRGERNEEISPWSN